MNQQVDDIFSDEGISGSSSIEKPPGLLGAIASLNKGDILVVAKRDRLGRGSPCPGYH